MTTTDLPHVRPFDVTRAPSLREDIASRSERRAAPAYGATAQQVISGLVDQLTTDNAKLIGSLRAELDALEQQMLATASQAKATLTGQLAVMGKVHGETRRVADTIDRIRAETGFFRE